jgi:hypothetical protein
VFLEEQNNHRYFSVWIYAEDFMDRIPRTRSFMRGDSQETPNSLPGFPSEPGFLAHRDLTSLAGVTPLPAPPFPANGPLARFEAPPIEIKNRAEQEIQLPISPRAIRIYLWGIGVFFIVHFAYLLFLQSRTDITTNNILRVITDVLVMLASGTGMIAGFVAVEKLSQMRKRQPEIVAQRSVIAALCLTLAIASYTIGQAIWTGYEITSASIPFPAAYDYLYLIAYPFGWAGVALLMPRNNTIAGRTRLLLDAGTAVASMAAISWFFVLGPTIANLSGSPEAKIVGMAYPLGDLSLSIMAAILLFGAGSTSPLSSTIGRLSTGYILLPLTSVFYSSAQLAGIYHTGFLSDVGWPIGWLFIGLAVLGYPNDLVKLANRRRAYEPAKKTTRLGTTGAAIRAIAPALLALGTCALLLFAIALHNTAPLIQVIFVCAILFLLPIVRQALTLIDNLMLNERLQIALDHSQQAFKDSQRELLSTSVRAEQLEELRSDIESLQNVHAMLSRGDLSVRARVQGPLAPVAQSLNLLVDRMGRWNQQMQQNQVLAHEAELIYQSLELLSEGQLVSNLPVTPSTLPTGRALFAAARLQNRLYVRFRRLRETVEMLGARLNTVTSLASNGRQAALSETSPQIEQTFARIEKSIESSQEVLHDFQGQTSGYSQEALNSPRPGIEANRP